MNYETDLVHFITNTDLGLIIELAPLEMVTHLHYLLDPGMRLAAILDSEQELRLADL